MPRENSPNQAGRSHPTKGRTTSRRRFLTAGLAAPLAVPRSVLGGTSAQAPSDTLDVAAVGIGGMGQHYLRGCGKDINVTALCDLDHRFSGRVFAQYPRAARYHDFRKMLSLPRMGCGL
jgi:hypothetical protein